MSMEKEKINIVADQKRKELVPKEAKDKVEQDITPVEPESEIHETPGVDYEKKTPEKTEKSLTRIEKKLTDKEANFVNSRLEQLDSEAIAKAMEIASAVKANVWEIRKYAWSTKFFKWIEEKANDYTTVLAAGIFPKVEIFLKKFFSDKEKVNSDEQERQSKELSIAGHTQMVTELLKSAGEQISRMKNTTDGGELADSVVRLKSLSQAIRMSHGDAIKFKQEMQAPEIFADLGIEKRKDLVELMNQYELMIPTVADAIDLTLSQINQVISSENLEKLQAEIKSKLLSGIVRLEDYKELVGPEILGVLTFRDMVTGMMGTDLNDNNWNVFGAKIRNESETLTKLKQFISGTNLKITAEQKELLFAEINSELESINSFPENTTYASPLDLKDKSDAIRTARKKLENSLNKTLNKLIENI